MPTPTVLYGVVVEEQVRFTLGDLSRACSVETLHVIALVDAGVLEPRGTGPDDWEFSGSSLRRALKALRLARDLELSAGATALVLSLLDEIERLRSQLPRNGAI